jgi:hypothetical protein
VVGVIDQSSTDAVSSNSDPASGSVNPQGFAASGSDPGSSAGDASELLVVAGLALRDWPGPTFEWPLGVRLRAFFSDSSWPDRSGPPEHVERQAFQRMGMYSDQRHEDVRFVAPTGDVAEALRALFSEASRVFGGEPQSLVVRDAWGDEYMVVLGTATCVRSASHHGDPCADVGDNPSGTGFDAQ